jgi:hypothetical protein
MWSKEEMQCPQVPRSKGQLGRGWELEARARGRLCRKPVRL